MTETPISMIRRRAIEAEMAAALIEGFAVEIGSEKAMAVAGRVIREVWCQEDTIEIRFIEETATSIPWTQSPKSDLVAVQEAVSR